MTVDKFLVAYGSKRMVSAGWLSIGGERLRASALREVDRRCFPEKSRKTGERRETKSATSRSSASGLLKRNPNHVGLLKVQAALETVIIFRCNMLGEINIYDQLNHFPCRVTMPCTLDKGRLK